MLRLQHHQVKKADSSTFLLNAARSIYWQGAIFDRQQRSRNVRNLLVSLATLFLLYVTVAPLSLSSIINHLEMRCIFQPCSTKLTRADGSLAGLASVARAYHDNQVSCLARTEVLAEINIDVFMTKVPGAVR